LRRDRTRASHVVEEREVIDVRHIGGTPAREMSEFDREQRISKRALCGNIVRQVGGERNRREEFRQPQALLRLRFVDYVPPPAVPIIRPLSRAVRRGGVNGARGDGIGFLVKTRTQQIDLGDALRPDADERDLFDNLVREAVSAQPETPAQSVSRPDLNEVGVQDHEVRRSCEPAFEAPSDLLAPRSDFRSSGQHHPRLRGGCQTLGETSEVARQQS